MLTIAQIHDELICETVTREDAEAFTNFLSVALPKLVAKGMSPEEALTTAINEATEAFEKVREMVEAGEYEI